MKIGDEVYIHGYIDEIRKDVVIIRNDGGYFGTNASEVILANRKTETQTEYPCNTCANKGDHDGECSNCIVNSEPIRWKIPSHYKPKTEPSDSEKPNNCETCLYRNCPWDAPICDSCTMANSHYERDEFAKDINIRSKVCTTCRFDDKYGEESICSDCSRHYSDCYEPKDEPQTEKVDRFPFDPLVEMDIKRMVEAKLAQTERSE